MKKELKIDILDNLQRNSVCVIFKPSDSVSHILILEELVNRVVSSEVILKRDTLEYLRDSEIEIYPLVYMSKNDFDELPQNVKARVSCVDGEMLFESVEDDRQLSKTTFSIQIEDKEYTKDELLKEVVMRMSNLEDGTYASTPDDYDDFYSSYSFKKI